MLGVSAVVACTKSSVSYEPAGEIALAPVNEINKTKTTVTDSKFPDQVMGVYAYYEADCPNGSPASAFKYATTYLDNVQFKKNGTDWAGWKDGAAYPYYWPKNGSLVFAAYSPLTDAAGDAAVKSHTFKADGTAVGSDIFESNETFAQSRLTDKTVDFMWSPVTSSSHTSASNHVAMTFYHAMSWITFRAKFTKPEGMVATTEPVITIKSLVLGKVALKGKFKTHVAEIEWTPIFDNAVSEAEQTITVFRGTQALTAESANVENNENGTLVIPQTITDDVVATIIYDQHVPGTATVEQKAVLHLSQCKVGGQALDKWQYAKHYIYDINFTFGTDDQIYIAPKVEPWKEENVSTEGAIEHK